MLCPEKWSEEWRRCQNCSFMTKSETYRVSKKLDIGQNCKVKVSFIYRAINGVACSRKA